MFYILRCLRDASISAGSRRRCSKVGANEASVANNFEKNLTFSAFRDDRKKTGQLKWALQSCDGTCTGWIGQYQRYIKTSAKIL